LISSPGASTGTHGRPRPVGADHLRCDPAFGFLDANPIDRAEEGIAGQQDGVQFATVGARQLDRVRRLGVYGVLRQRLEGRDQDVGVSWASLWLKRAVTRWLSEAPNST
jgi:hypothetical protein